MLKNKTKQPKNQDVQVPKEVVKGDAAALPEKVTNSTLHLHRKQVINKGKKLKYPFYHSRHRVVILSSLIIVVSLVGFFAFNTIRLYKYKPTDGFSYSLTKLIPYPIARVDGVPVKYADYLFELRVTLYSMERSDNIDFDTPRGEQMLGGFERAALNKAENFAYMRHIAKENNIKVTDEDVDNAINEIKLKSLNVKSLDKISDDSVFYRTIKTEYNWPEADLRKSVEDLLYTQKVKSILDTDTASRANSTLDLITTGKNSKKTKDNFAKLAKEFSDDKSSANRGGSVAVVSKGQAGTNDVPKVVVDELFRLDVGAHSGVIKTDDALYIIKNEKTTGDKRNLAYMKFTYKDNLSYIESLRKSNKISEHISVQPN